MILFILNRLQDIPNNIYLYLGHLFYSPVKHIMPNFKMDMINSNYKIDMQIDRPKLHQLLIKKKIRAIFEPCIKASVIIKIPIKDIYNLEIDNNIIKDNNNSSNNKDISVFIFQKGNIIINSAKSRDHIIKCYEYINNILYTYKDDIIKIDDKIENEIIFKHYNKIIADAKCGLIQLNEIEHNILSSKLYCKKNKNI